MADVKDTKRLLTPQEIQYVVSWLRYPSSLTEEAGEIFMKRTKQLYIDQFNLSKTTIYPSLIPRLAQRLERDYYDSLAQAGDPVGTQCGQSIGEKTTQITLNLFHAAGAESGTGEAKLKELLGASRNPKSPMCIIHMADAKKYNTIQQVRNKVGHSIRGFKLVDLILTMKSNFNPIMKPWYKLFYLYTNTRCCNKYKHCISIQLNNNLLYEYKIPIELICKAISDVISTNIHIIHSCTEIGEIDIFINTTTICDAVPDSTKKYFYNLKKTCNPASIFKSIYFDEFWIPTLKKIHICGIKGIKNVCYTKDITKLVAPGKNFIDVMGLPYIDKNKTITNSIWDTFTVLGISATRRCLIELFKQVMDINPSHFMILVAKMTYRGYPAAVNRFSMSTEKFGPFVKSTFEQAFKIFIKESARGINEPIDCTVTNIMFGKHAHVGSGYPHLIYPLDYKHETKLDKSSNMEELSEDYEPIESEFLNSDSIVLGDEGESDYSEGESDNDHSDGSYDSTMIDLDDCFED